MTTPIAQGQVDVNVRPVAWLHDQQGRYDVVHDKAKALWLKAWPKQVEHYTIPLYASLQNAAWWALVMGAAAALEDAANCLTDPDAKRAAEGAAKHYRTEANTLWPNAKVSGDGTASAGLPS